MAATARKVALDGLSLVTLHGEPRATGEPLEQDQELRMSRFAWIRRDGEAVVAETSLGPAAVVLEDPRAHALLLTFCVSRRLDPTVADAVDLPLQTALDVASVLRDAFVLVDPVQAAAEDEPPLAVWEFHDLLFHARSRSGRHRNPSGGTYRFRERFGPAPALPPARWPESIELERPDYDRLELDDPPLTRVQAARSSIRHYGERPLTINQLGEFLYRVGRVEDYWEMALPGTARSPMSFAAKPYPAGGAAYELELYPAVQRCEGLDPGLYHYDAASHCLARAGGATPALRELIAREAAGMGAAPDSIQVLIVISARFARIAWKYQSIAYELVLKHVGVVLQTMYLVATAMELAPCAIGTGDSDLFASVSGIDYYEETAVGELALGSRPTGNQAAGPGPVS